MEYKVLVRVYVPEIEESYEMYIPVNKTIGEILTLLNKMINDLTKVYPATNNADLYNRQTGVIYGRGCLVRDTDIRNGTEIVLWPNNHR